MKTAADIRIAVALTAFGLILVLGIIFAFFPESAAKPAAVTEISKSRPTNTENLEDQFQRAVLLLQSNHLELAASAFEKIIQRMPHMPEAYVNLGYALIGMGRFTDARVQFEKALEMNSRQSNAYYGLALSHEGEGDIEKALGAMKTFVHLSDESDRFVRKARSAIWEWEAARETSKGSFNE